MNQGATDELISDSVQATTSQKVKEIPHMSHISPTIVNLTINPKTTMNALGISKMSQTMYSPSQVPLITYGYYVLCMWCTSST